MTQVVSPSDPQVRDFSSHNQVRFRLDHANGEEDYFEGVPDLPALLLVEFAGTMEEISKTQDLAQQSKMFTSLFELVLLEDSATRFIERMGNKADPISLMQINDIMPWIMEQYGMRPTMPSENSSDGSAPQESGTSSTESSSPAELTSPPSLQPVS